MAQAADQHTPKTLDDAARFLIKERGYKKNPALCWEILEQIWAKRITLRRHWKKYDLNGNPQEDGTEVVNPAVCRNLDFDRRGHIRLVPEWDGDRYTIVEPCDFRIIWPPPASQAAPDQQLEDKTSLDPVKTGDADRPSAGQRADGPQVRRVKEVLREFIFPPDGRAPANIPVKTVRIDVNEIFAAWEWKLASHDSVARAMGRRRR